MRRWLMAVPVAVMMLALASPAGAFPHRAYPLYGNGSTGDCPIAAMAGLTEHQFPAAHVTDAQAVAAFRWSVANGDDEISYMESRGFNGYRIASAFPVTNRAQFIAAANAGGVEATIENGQHAVAVIRASTRFIWWIDYGYVVHDSWPVWLDVYHATWTDDVGVTWAPRDTHDAVVIFEGSYETSSMTPQAEPVGTTATLEPLGMVNAGYKFDGWATNGNGTGRLLADGARFHFTAGTVLWATWTYTGGN